MENLFNILHINTSINLLDIVINNNEDIKNNSINNSELENTDQLVKLYNDKINF